MRLLILFAVIMLTIVPWTTTLADEPPIPQDRALQEKRLQNRVEWTRKTMGEAYEKVGKKDPRWDVPARKALNAAATPDITRAEIYKAARLAVEAGCDDAMIQYLYAHNSGQDSTMTVEEYKRRMIQATEAMEKSDYPPIRRALIMMTHALALMNDRMTPEDRKESGRLLDAALDLVQPSLERDGRGEDAAKARNDLVWDILTGQKYLMKNPEEAFAKVDAVLAKTPGLQVLRLQIEGEYLTHYAWEARGIGIASTVKADAWLSFEDRLTRAKRSLQRAWELEPTGAKTPTLMLTALKGLGCERPEMETWFRRAMEADTNNFEACFQKMEWLDPKWYGSPDEVLAFGKACRDTRNWGAKLTLLGAESHYRYVQRAPQDEFRKYFAREDVWDEIRSTFEEYLTHRPNDPAARSSYAALCFVCGKIAESAKQFEIVGDKLTPTNFYLMDMMKQVRDHVIARAKSESKPRK